VFSLTGVRTPIDGLVWGTPLAFLVQIQRLVNFYELPVQHLPPNKLASGESYWGRDKSRVKRAKAIQELGVVGDLLVEL